MKNSKKGLAFFRINKDDVANAGVVQKMQAQVAALRASGLIIDHVYLGRKGIYRNEELTHRFRLPVLQKRWLTYLFYFFRWPFIVCRQTNWGDYDFLYIRYPMMHPGLMNLIRRAKQSGLRVVLEIPTWPYDEEPRTFLHRLSLRLDRLYRNRLNRYVDRILHYGLETSIYSVPTLPIRNGVEIHQIPFTPSTPAAGRLRLLAVAHWSYWHGLDRLLKGMADYLQTKAEEEALVELTIVGAGRALTDYQVLTHKLALTSAVRFLPPTQGPELWKLFEKADLGIGTLGMHRKGVAIDSSLKHRVYCASGLPFILSRQDADFPSDLPFVQYFPDSDASLDFRELLRFFNSLSFPNTHQQMRFYAEERLGWQQQFQDFIDWLDQR